MIDRRLSRRADVLAIPHAMDAALPSVSDLLAAHDAAEALNALGLSVQAAEDGSETWRIGYFMLTADEVIGLASRRGIRPAPKMVQ